MINVVESYIKEVMTISESLETRYNTYVEKTQPLIDFYSAKGNLYTVDSNKGSEYTFEQVTELLKTLGDKLD